MSVLQEHPDAITPTCDDQVQLDGLGVAAFGTSRLALRQVNQSVDMNEVSVRPTTTGQTKQNISIDFDNAATTFQGFLGFERSGGADSAISLESVRQEGKRSLISSVLLRENHGRLGIVPRVASRSYRLEAYDGEALVFLQAHVPTGTQAAEVDTTYWDCYIDLIGEDDSVWIQITIEDVMNGDDRELGWTLASQSAGTIHTACGPITADRIRIVEEQDRDAAVRERSALGYVRQIVRTENIAEIRLRDLDVQADHR